MPRKAQGTTFVSDGAIYASVTVAPKKRMARALTFLRATDEAEALAWAQALQSLVDALRTASRDPEISGKIDLALEVGRASPRDGLIRVMASVAKLSASVKADELAALPAIKGGITFKAFGQKWTKGDLHNEYPDHVPKKKTADKDAGLLDRYVYPVVGPIALTKFTLRHAQEVMRRVPRDLSSAWRRQVAQVMVRLCNLAVYPCELLEVSPLPKGFLPKVRTRAGGYLYPAEDRSLLGHVGRKGKPGVPLANRLLYGFLAREGMRKEEALALTWVDLDLQRGAVRLDENKTDDPRAWALDPGVTKALKWWREKRYRTAPADALVFADVEDTGHLADTLRVHMKAAGIDRPELFEHNEKRRQMNVHGLRSTFVTIALANGKSEAWVCDRTGHRSSTMVARYKRTARTAAELGLGPLTPLDRALPEIASKGAEGYRKKTTLLSRAESSRRRRRNDVV
jgi:integrase